MDNSGKITLSGDLASDLGDLYYDNSSDYNSSYENCCEWDVGLCDMTDGMSFGAVFIPVLYTVAFVVGILGNGVLLGVLVQSRRTWSVTDTFILHLGVADVLLLATLPLWAAQAGQARGWTFGTPLCKITGAVFTVRGVQHERWSKTICN